MKTPAFENTEIDEQKIANYLLSGSHPIGRFKSEFFRSLGYTASDWNRLKNDLLELARSGSAQPGGFSEYGLKYEVHGNLQGPNGRQAQVKTIWIVLNGEETPRFVTAMPGARS